MATWYYSQSTGADGNAGTILAPKQTLADLKSTVGVGDTAALMAGDTWDEKAELDASPANEGERITITRYGTGADPKISRQPISTFTGAILPDQTLTGTNDYSIGAYVPGDDYTPITFTSAVLTTGAAGHLNHGINFQQDAYGGYIIENVVSTTECRVTGDATGEGDDVTDTLILSIHRASDAKSIITSSTSSTFTAGNVFDSLYFADVKRSTSIATHIDDRHVIVEDPYNGIGASESCEIWDDAAANGFAFQFYGKDYITLDRLDFDGYVSADFDYADHIVISDCTFQNCHGGTNGHCLLVCSWSGASNGGSEDWTIDGCIFQDISGAATSCIFGVGRETSVATHVSDITVSNCIFRRIDTDAVTLWIADNSIVENCTIGPGLFGIGGGHQDGINIAGGDGYIIRYNTIFDFTQLIYFTPNDIAGVVPILNHWIYGNVLYVDKYWTDEASAAPGINVDIRGGDYTVDGLEIWANTIVYLGDAEGTGVKLLTQGPGVGTITNVVARNNIFYDCAGTGYEATSAWSIGPDIDPTDYDIDYNCYKKIAKSSAAEANSLIDSDPLFVNYIRHSVWDFHLQSGSPCDGAGDPALTAAVTVPTPLYDIGGVERTPDSGDMGAYEKAAAGGGAAVQQMCFARRRRSD
jgi:hypothetical protein